MQQLNRINGTVPQPTGLGIDIQQHRNRFFSNLNPLLAQSLGNGQAHAWSGEEYLAPSGSK